MSSNASIRSNVSNKTAQPIRYGSDLFNYDQRSCASQILLTGANARSQVEYDEYVVYRKIDDSSHDAASGKYKWPQHGDNHIAHRYSKDHTSGAAMLDLAFRHGHRLDRNGNFTPADDENDPQDDSVGGMLGRVRRVICFRRSSRLAGAPDQLSMTAEDLADLDLHPATLQYATRVATESRFWSRDRSVLSLILSFSETPQTPCDFLSMTYNVDTQSTTILIRQSWEPRRHRLDELDDEYDHRLESCRDHWAHPLVMPVILLQVDFVRCEEAVAENTLDVIHLEQLIIGAHGSGSGMEKLSRRHSNLSRDDSKVDHYGPMNMASPMRRAHEVLRGTIKLLDTIRWMERAVKILMLSGDELSDRVSAFGYASSVKDLNMGGDRFGNFERQPSPLPTLQVPGLEPLSPGIATPFTSDSAGELSIHWHELRQYLEGLLRLSMSLETERRMAEARCRAQIDIIYSRMAQEDNALNARMAVASTRDSASMKALAVITAIFLPGEFIGTLFGMSMFDWLAPSKDDDKTAAASARDEPESDEILSHQFWVYWTIAIPLTMFIICAWRAWWVIQDRYFRRHLSRELSEERFWTEDGKPRNLERSFIHDFFYLSARRDEKASVPRGVEGWAASMSDKDGMEGLTRVQTRASETRHRQILTARQTSIKLTSNAA
ncbi:unnamed protein product [Clonostachys chloroleuca]|uniref:Uncharacterized protein n=1 Tax=Clonostachys chloroleuca TaxID=1926264 RepID=A0AA35Q902_9HYPO|nr:unnamed protein product [Clonostachys chloroleuca]